MLYFFAKQISKKCLKGENPLYVNVTYDTEDTEVKHVNDYYYGDQPGDTAEVTDPNEYYNSHMWFWFEYLCIHNFDINSDLTW